LISVNKLQEMQEEQRPTSRSSVQGSTSFKSEDDSISQAALESDMDKSIVRLNTVTEGRPLFILHSAGGGVLVMQKVAQKVNYPVYGVQDTPEAPITGTLDHLSHFYLSKIKERQPLGPYHLSGFSFGTALVANIAQILQAEGARVEVLIMLDGAPTLFHRQSFRDYAMRGIVEGNLRDNVCGFFWSWIILLMIILRWIDIRSRWRYVNQR
jgi:fatty acid synthase, animal type